MEVWEPRASGRARGAEDSELKRGDTWKRFSGRKRFDVSSDRYKRFHVSAFSQTFRRVRYSKTFLRVRFSLPVETFGIILGEKQTRGNVSYTSKRWQKSCNVSTGRSSQIHKTFHRPDICQNVSTVKSVSTCTPRHQRFHGYGIPHPWKRFPGPYPWKRFCRTLPVETFRNVSTGSVFPQNPKKRFHVIGGHGKKQTFPRVSVLKKRFYVSCLDLPVETF